MLKRIKDFIKKMLNRIIGVVLGAVAGVGGALLVISNPAGWVLATIGGALFAAGLTAGLEAIFAKDEKYSLRSMGLNSLKVFIVAAVAGFACVGLGWALNMGSALVCGSDLGVELIILLRSIKAMASGAINALTQHAINFIPFIGEKNEKFNPLIYASNIAGGFVEFSLGVQMIKWLDSGMRVLGKHIPYNALKFITERGEIKKIIESVFSGVISAARTAASTAVKNEIFRSSRKEGIGLNAIMGGVAGFFSTLGLGDVPKIIREDDVIIPRIAGIALRRSREEWEASRPSSKKLEFKPAQDSAKFDEDIKSDIRPAIEILNRNTTQVGSSKTISHEDALRTLDDLFSSDDEESNSRNFTI